MPLAYGLACQEISGPVTMGRRVDELPAPGLMVKPVRSDYAYLIKWDALYAPAALNELLNAGIIVKVATNSFEMELEGRNMKFNYGTLLVPVQSQSDNKEAVHTMINSVMLKHKLMVYGITSGNVSSGSDMGSNKFVPVTKPSIAMITGPGVNATDAGEVWHLLDQRMNMPATHLEPSVFNRIELNKYNTLIMVGGSYPDINKDKLKTWVQAGGVLILTEEAVTWASQNGISDVKFKRAKAPVDSTQKLSYTDREQIDGSQQIQGAIFGADADLAHPLAYGYNQKTISLFKANKVFMEKSKNPYATPFYYGSKPLQSGWVSRENGDAIKNSAAVIVNAVGNGRVISIADNPNFRAFWLGGSKLFMNAIFFGRIIDAASARTE